MKHAVWINGKKRITGRWLYNWASDTFTIVLDSVDQITGEERRLKVHGDRPEWGNWRLDNEH